MRHSNDRRNKIQEPIRKPWLWLTIVVIVLVGSPLFWANGTIEPLVFGIPLWLLSAVVFTLVFALVVSVVCVRFWNIEEPEEERAFAEGRDPWALDDEDSAGGESWRT